MILTESRLKQIIAEEINNLLSEEQLDEASRLTRRIAGGLAGLAGIAGLGYGAGRSAGDEGIPRDRGTVTAKADSKESDIERYRPEFKKNKTAQASNRTVSKKKTDPNTVKANIKAIKPLRDSDDAFVKSPASDKVKRTLEHYYVQSKGDIDIYNNIVHALRNATKLGKGNETQTDYHVYNVLRSNLEKNPKVRGMLKALNKQLGMGDYY